MNMLMDRLNAALGTLGFTMERQEQETVFVRESDVRDVFECFECVVVGAKQDALVISVALSTVRHIAFRFRGLFARDGWPEICSDAENGRVTFRTSGALRAWVERVSCSIGERFERLHMKAESALLAKTEAARCDVERILKQVPAEDCLRALVEPGEGLTQSQAELMTAVLRLPFTVPEGTARRANEAALVAMIRAGAEGGLEALVRAEVPATAVARVGAVPVDVVWRIRLLADRIMTVADAAKAAG